MKDWDALYEECIHCQKCGLAETRTNVVFGEGARDAEVMFIGEGPGEQEDRTGRPFVGRAGQLLDDMLAMIDLKREKVFIGNMVKCRPPQNRDPLNIEQEACIGYLRNQVALLKPKIIVCLGRIAAMKLIKEDFKITREHGQWIEKAGVWMMAMYHPSALLRDPRKRPESFEDLKSLQAKIREVCVAHIETKVRRNSASLLFCGHPLDDLQTGKLLPLLLLQGVGDEADGAVQAGDDNVL